MDTRKSLRDGSQFVMVALASTMLLAASVSVACTPGPTATPAAFDIKATLDKFLSNLPDDWGALTPANMNDRLSARVFIVDVREQKEMAEGGYIEGSINIPIRSFAKNLDKLPAKDKSIIVICSSGHRSALAMEALQLLGFNYCHFRVERHPCL